MIPGLPDRYLFLIAVLEAGLIASCFADYSIGIGVFGTMSALTVGYLHLTLLPYKIRPFVERIDPEAYRREMRWGILIAPILFAGGPNFPVTGVFPTDYSVDIWKLLFFCSVSVWFLTEGVIRIRF